MRDFICTSVYSATSLCEIKWADCATAVTHLFTNVCLLCSEKSKLDSCFPF